MSEFLEITENEVESMLKLGNRHISVDAPFAEGEDHGLLDVMEDASALKADTNLMQESLKKEISRTLSKLPDRESQVVKLFYGIDGVREISLDEIGSKFNLTRERVRQIKEKAIKRLRSENRQVLLKSYLG